MQSSLVPHAPRRRLSYSEWLESKESALEDARYSQLEVAQRRRASLGSRKQESAAHYDAWLQHKDQFERAVSLLQQLHVDRCKVDDKWFQVAVSLNAIDCLRGIRKAEGYQDLPADRDTSHDADKQTMAGRRTLEQEFYRWSRRASSGHEFRDVTVSPSKVHAFSAAARSMMSEYAEDALQRKGEYVQASLKYTVPKVEQKAHDKRDLYNPDTVKFNAIFNRLARQQYAAAREEMFDRLDEECRRAGQDNEEEKEEDLVAIQRKVLHRLGLGQLAKWVEQDAQLEEQERREKKQEERENAENMHRMFVAKKDRLRVRLPAKAQAKARRKSAGSGAGRMNFALGPDKVYRSKMAHAAPQGTLEIVRAAGMKSKYTYCANERDLEKAREALRRQGHVLKENFKDEDGDALLEEYYRAREEASAEKAREMAETEEKRKRQADAQFSSWFDQKERRESAEKLLKRIEAPGKRGESGAEDESHWRQVAEQLKAVDTGLLQAFIEWSQGYRSPAQCTLLWESLAPTCCDTCCVSTYVHKTLLKFLNRPGVDFKSIFDREVDRYLAKQMRSDGREVDEATEEERRQAESGLELSPKAFITMMKHAGIAVNRHEARILTSLFDENGDGKISRKEFLRFTGERERPNNRGDALSYLRAGKLCIWEACCHVTGQINAFEVIPTGASAESKQEEELSERKNTRPVLLRSGKEKPGWLRLPLPDYIRRKQRLISMGEKTLDDFRSTPPKTCAFAAWSDKLRDQALQALRANPSLKEDTMLMADAMISGTVPADPWIRLKDIPSATDHQRERELNLEWGVDPDAAFYVIESCSEGKQVFEEVHRDPPSAADDGHRPSGKWTYKGLKPGQRVDLRIRAFNGHGPSSFAYASFVTAPSRPIPPVADRISPIEITVSFDESRERLRISPQALKEVLARAFEATREENGLAKLDDVLRQLSETDSADPVLRSGLHAVAETLRGDFPPFVSLEDLEEAATRLPRQRRSSDGDVRVRVKSRNLPGKIAGEETFMLCKCVSDEEVDIGRFSDGSLEEVAMRVLKASQWHADRCQLDLPIPQLLEAPQLSADATEKPSLRVLIPLSTQHQKQKQKRSVSSSYPPQRIGRLQEPIIHLEVYQQVYAGAEPRCSLSSILPGESLQLRLVHARKADNYQCSRMSEPLLVHVPLKRPAAPLAAEGKISTDGARVSWSLQDSEASNRDWEGVVKTWTKDAGGVASGVNEATIRKMFLRYDMDGNGMIEGGEVERLLGDLGVTGSKSGREYALAALDRSGDGRISYKEFAQWLTSQMRSAVLLHKVKGKDKRWETVYRGVETEVDVAGLEANTVHCFAIQIEMHRVSSAISPMLEVMTAPEIPQQPIAVQVGAKQCWVKWYAGHGGAERFSLEMVQVERLSGSSDEGRPNLGVWKEVYNGKRSICLVEGLEESSVYRMKVKAVNRKGLSSAASLPSQIVTMGPNESLEKLQGKANAAAYFEIECTGDVVVGDTILFSERVFRRSRDGSASKSLPSTSTLSQQSISSLGRMKSSAQEFVCERTVAAQVLNQKMYMDRPRDLVCQVLWSTLSSKEAPKKYALAPGSRITRSEKEMFKFETFRARWAQEDQRWSYNEEREANLVMLPQ